MKIEDLKTIIESKKYNGEPIIFNNYENCGFLVHQYIHEILKIKGFNHVFVNNISEIPEKTNNFLVLNENEFYIYYTDKDKELRQIVNLSNCVIIYTGKKLKDYEDIEPYVVDIPKLNDVQIKEYVYSRGDGVSKEGLDYLIGLIGNDLYRLEKELDKLSIFDESSRNTLFNKFINDGVFSDLSNYNNFNLVDAIVKRRPQTALKIYHELEDMGINEMGVFTLLYNNIRNIIKIQLSPNPTPENTDLKSNQFWAIKKNNINYYSKDDLLYIFGLLTSMDKKIKTGEIPTDKLIEYILIHILR